MSQLDRQPLIQISGPEGRMERYIRAVLRAGGRPAAAYAPQYDPCCQGLVLCGGGDLDPARYGQENRGSQPPDHRQDEAELALAEAFLRAGKPILAVCRGMQLVNVLLGGTLIQDLPGARKAMHQGERDVFHPIRTAPGSLVGALFGPWARVNSIHHQAVDVLGGELRPTAWAPDDTVEALEHTRLPVAAVQFHPERLPGAEFPGDCLFRWLTERAGQGEGAL